MSTTTQNIDQQSTEIKSSIPTWQDIEKAILVILRAAIENFPNEEAYNQTMEDHEGYYKKDPRIQKAIKTYYILCYTIVKDTFATEEEIEEELDSWINS
ncbi:hypothetical protein Glove_68g17 [Diversispora epigaea]|uniref:Uncharacterized protein n=1 Tax=Diversispora epigaea TaxID=1348612 RepID=A0A397JA76_9GLOM|nr:hypothetical protein Glove_68g17 [Diversispora epigaea]